MSAEVIVDIAAGETDRIFDYIAGDGVTVGSRVRAPFGGKTLPGFVMRLKDRSEVPPEKLKKVVPYEAEVLALIAECLRMADKFAARYRVPKALALRLFLPAEMRTGKVRELYKNYAENACPISQMAFRKSAKNQIAVAEYLEKNGKTE